MDLFDFWNFLGIFGVHGIFFRIGWTFWIFKNNLLLEKSCFPCRSILQYYTGGNIFSAELRINPTFPRNVVVKSPRRLRGGKNAHSVTTP